MKQATRRQFDRLPKFYVRSGELAAVVLAVDETHAAGRLIQLLMAGRVNGYFEPAIEVSQSGRLDEAVEIETYRTFLLLGLLPLTVSREQFRAFYFPED